MTENKERRYIVKLVQEVLDKFSARVNPFELKDIVQTVVENKDNSFDLGFFFLHDQVKNSFTLGGLYPQESENFIGITDDIEKKLRCTNSIPDLDSPLQEGCGLYLYVARNFKKDYESERIYVAINDVAKFKKEDKLAKFHIEIDPLKHRIQSEYIFPVYINNDQQNQYTPKRILHAVIVLVSLTKVNQIREQDLKILSDIISFIISVEARAIANKAFQAFINTLSNVGTVLYSRTEYDKIIKSLKLLYVSNETKSTLKQCLLKHASIWTLNDKDPENIFLVKEKNFNVHSESLDITNIITNKLIGTSGNCHYFYEFITKKMQQINNLESSVPFQELIEIKRFSEIGDRFYQKENFKSSSNIDNDDIVVLFPITAHIEKDHGKTTINDSKKPRRIGLIILYFDKNTCSYYYNANFLEIMSHKIYENMQIVIQKTRREIRESIFEGISQTLKNDVSFFSKAASVLKEKVDFEHCLIYIFRENRTELELKTPENIYQFPKLFDIDNLESVNTLFDIVKESHFAEKILEYIKELQHNPNATEHIGWYSQDFAALEEKNENNRLYSAMLIPIGAAKNPTTGVLICLNNWRNIDTDAKKERSVFSFKDYEIASIGAEVIGTYVEIFNHAGLYKKLLKRLAHEIPTQSTYIMQNAEQFKDELFEIMNNVQKQVSYTGEKISIDNKKYKRILNLLHYQRHAAYQVQLYAEYTRCEKLNMIDLKKEIENLDMLTFFSSIIEGFRLNAEAHGIFVEFRFIYELPHKKNSIIEAHPLIQLAIWNLINNAIQYSYFGTNVLITFIDGLSCSYINVENIGIPIPKEITEKLFEENYRSPEAKIKYFKGTGFGLTLAKSVVKAHSGDIIPEAKNNLCDRNIFGISEIRRILDAMKSDEEREKYINQNSINKTDYSHFKESLMFNNKESEILNKTYKDFLVSYSDRSDTDLIKRYLKSRFDGNETLDIIFNREVSVPISHVKFSIVLPKQIK